MGHTLHTSLTRCDLHLQEFCKWKEYVAPWCTGIKKKAQTLKTLVQIVLHIGCETLGVTLVNITTLPLPNKKVFLVLFCFVFNFLFFML